MSKGVPAVRDERTINVDYCGRAVVIPIKGDDLVSLTDIWRAAGSPENKDPRFWLRTEQAKGFVGHIMQSLNVTKNHVIQIVRGRGVATSGTFAHRQIALAYAKYLSHRLHEAVNEAFFEWAEEKRDPGLKLDRAIDGYRQRGWSDEHIKERLDSKLGQKRLMSRMADHNCRKLGRSNPFASANKSISLCVTGQTPKEYREERGIVSKSQLTRDDYTRLQLARVNLLQIESEHAIARDAADGNEACLASVQRTCNTYRPLFQKADKQATA